VQVMLCCILLLPLVLASCGDGNKELTVVRVGEVTRSIFYAPQYIAIEQGYFAEEGLDVELTTTWGGDKTMTTLLSGGIDVALVGSETSIYVYLQGSDDPVVNFAQLTQTDGTFLVSRQEANSFDWEQLKGSTFLGQRKGGMPQMAGEFTLKQHGIDPQEDLELIQHIDFANIASSFASGTGDYVQLFEPQATVFEMEGKGYVLASFGVESGLLPYTVFMSKQSYIEQNEVIVQKFTNAVYRAQQWLMEADTAEAAKVISPYFEDTDTEVIRLVIERYRDQDSYALHPSIDEAEWNRLQDVMEEAGELPKRVDHAILVNNQYAENAVEHVK